MQYPIASFNRKHQEGDVRLEIEGMEFNLKSTKETVL